MEILWCETCNGYRAFNRAFIYCHCQTCQRYDPKAETKERRESRLELESLRAEVAAPKKRLAEAETRFELQGHVLKGALGGIVELQARLEEASRLLVEAKENYRCAIAFIPESGIVFRASLLYKIDALTAFLAAKEAPMRNLQPSILRIAKRGEDIRMVRPCGAVRIIPAKKPPGGDAEIVCNQEYDPILCCCCGDKAGPEKRYLEKQKEEPHA